MQPSVAVNDLGGSRRVVVVALHLHVTAGTDLSGLTNRHNAAGLRVHDDKFGVREHTPDGCDTPFKTVIGGGHGNARCGLGQTIHDDDLFHVHLVADLPHPLNRTGGTGHDTGTETGEVIAGEVRVFKFCDEHGRNTVHRRAPFILNGFHHCLGVKERGRDHHGGPVRHACHIREHHAKAVIERNRNAELVLFGKLHAVTDDHTVVEDRVVREHNSFRVSGGTAGVLDV